MRLDSLVQVVFSEQEVKEALLLRLDLEANDLVEGSPENKRIRQLIKHIESETGCLEWEGNNLILLADGIAFSEELG